MRQLIALIVAAIAAAQTNVPLSYQGQPDYNLDYYTLDGTNASTSGNRASKSTSGEIVTEPSQVTGATRCSFGNSKYWLFPETITEETVRSLGNSFKTKGHAGDWVVLPEDGKVISDYSSVQPTGIKIQLNSGLILQVSPVQYLYPFKNMDEPSTGWKAKDVEFLYGKELHGGDGIAVAKSETVIKVFDEHGNVVDISNLYTD